MGLHTLEVWRFEYWLIAYGSLRTAEKFDILELCFYHPQWLEPWFEQLEARIKESTRLVERVIGALEPGSFSEAELDRIKKILLRGVTLNNPHIPKSLPCQPCAPDGCGGIHIDLERAADHLRELVAEYPLSV